MRNRPVTIDFDRCWPISSGLSRVRENEEEGEEEEWSQLREGERRRGRRRGELGFLLASRDPSTASLRNCSLQGTIPDLSQIPRLGYLDLSWNQLKGPLPSKLSVDITTIDLSHNYLNGTIPLTFSGLPKLQKL
ncbi:hypothetical protein GW17_00014858 [Ensete ventricosum]|nr:hypothetical protein GW17_00014858 [Ensete ventricosum]